MVLTTASMDLHITPARFNALPFNEKLGYVIKAGELIRSDDDEAVYRVFNFNVRATMEWEPLRITSCVAFEPDEVHA